MYNLVHGIKLSSVKHKLNIPCMPWAKLMCMQGHALVTCSGYSAIGISGGKGRSLMQQAQG